MENSKPEFCVISPIAGLERYAKLSKHHLVLAHMLHQKEYEQFYITRRLAGDLVILDNGAYENTKPVDNAAYVNLIKRLNPQVVVLPDQLRSPWRITTSLTFAFLDQYVDVLRNYQIDYMFVPQTDCSLDDWKRSLLTVVNDGRVGHLVKWVGLGRFLTSDYGWNTRIDICNWIRRRSDLNHLRIHALGMAAGNVNELYSLNKEGCESIDSSAPVWRGYFGQRIRVATDRELWNVTGTPCDLNRRDLPSPEHHSVILENLEACGVNTRSITG